MPPMLKFHMNVMHVMYMIQDGLINGMNLEIPLKSPEINRGAVMFAVEEVCIAVVAGLFIKDTTILVIIIIIAVNLWE